MTDDPRHETTNGLAEVPRPVTPAAAGGERRRPLDLDDRQKVLLAVVLVVHVLLARLTLRDLRRRPDSAVRGPKGLWRLWAMANTTGSLAYWLVGRRREPTP